MKKKEILHITTGLEGGGAEGVLYRLCTNDSINSHTVISLTNTGIYGPRLTEKGINVYVLNMPRGRVTVSGVYTLWKLISSLKPDVIQTWMYHSDLLGGIIAKICGHKNIVWNIRNSTLDAQTSSMVTRFVARLCAMLSNFIPTKIACCANEAADIHIALGYAKQKFFIIPNGFDTSIFTPNLAHRENIRTELNLKKQITFGMIGRWDPQKDHKLLLESLAQLKQNQADFVCILAGKNINQNNSILTELIRKNDLEDEIKLLDRRDDIADLMNSLDVHILSSSYGEAFPNVIAEAMACGVPCISTDIGDAKSIIDNYGWVVPAKSKQELVNAMEESLKLIIEQPDKYAELKAHCSMRIRSFYSLEAMIENYNKIWHMKLSE